MKSAATALKDLERLTEGLNCLCDDHREQLRNIISRLEAPPAAERTALKERVEESMQIISTNSKRWNDPDGRYIFGVLMDTKDLLDAASASEGTKSE